MKIIGLTGGIGSGKSTIANLMKENYHAQIIIADEIGRLALLKGQNCYDKIVQYFGDDILNENGDIDRARLSDIVFCNSEKLEVLNSIIHPFVREYIENEVKRLRGGTEVKLLVIESAILIEVGYDNICDEIWYVSSKKEIRTKRLISSRGYSEEKIESIMKNQSSDMDFNEKCLKIIYNNGEIKEINKQLEILLV